jgi:LysM repeat protein
MATFLAIGGLLSGVLWSSFFASTPAGLIREKRNPGGAELISQAEGAQVDSAALIPQSSPFLASAGAGASAQVAENVDVLYGEGAIKDPGQTIKTKTVPPSDGNGKKLAAGGIYSVTRGDTLASISVAFNIPINTIIEFNPSVNFSALTPGVSIIIPSQKDAALLEG